MSGSLWWNGFVCDDHRDMDVYHAAPVRIATLGRNGVSNPFSKTAGGYVASSGSWSSPSASWHEYKCLRLGVSKPLGYVRRNPSRNPMADASVVGGRDDLGSVLPSP